MFSTALSTASIASGLSIVGLPASIPIGGVSAVFAAASSSLIIASKKLDSKIKKHQETVLIVCFPKLWPTIKFQLLMAEFSQYNVLKGAVRAKLTRQSSRPDVEKIKKDVRSEIEAEFGKK